MNPDYNLTCKTSKLRKESETIYFNKIPVNLTGSHSRYNLWHRRGWNEMGNLEHGPEAHRNNCPNTRSITYQG